MEISLYRSYRQLSIKMTTCVYKIFELTSKPKPRQSRSISASTSPSLPFKVNVQFLNPGFSTTANCSFLHPKKIKEKKNDNKNNNNNTVIIIVINKPSYY